MGAGCGVRFQNSQVLPEEIESIIKTGDLFRERLIAEVRTLREEHNKRRHDGSQHCTESQALASHEDGAEKHHHSLEGKKAAVQSVQSMKSVRSCRSEHDQRASERDDAGPQVTTVRSIDSVKSRASWVPSANEHNFESAIPFTSHFHSMGTASKSNLQLKPLRSNSAISRGSTIGARKIETSHLLVRVPGKLGCEDDQVLVGDGDEHMILRTKRVHKHKHAAKKNFAQRRLGNLESAQDEDSQVRSSDGDGEGRMALQEEERRSVLKILQRHFLFSSLAEEEYELLMEQMLHQEKRKDDVVCRKGEQGDACYIIISGTCTVHDSADKQLARLSTGHTFGELAMLYDIPRTATIICSSPRVVLGVIRGPAFRRSLARIQERNMNETLGFLTNHHTFSTLAHEEKMMLALSLCSQTFPQGGLLIDEYMSSTAEWMFLVQEGTVEVVDQYKNRRALGEGATISGERMPYGHKAVVAKALTSVKCYSIGYSTISRLFGNISEVLRCSTVRSFLESIPFFAELTDKQQTLAAGLFQNQHVRKGEVIVSALADSQLVVIMDGEVSVVDHLEDTSPRTSRSGRILVQERKASLPGSQKVMDHESDALDVETFVAVAYGSEPELERPIEGLDKPKPPPLPSCEAPVTPAPTLPPSSGSTGQPVGAEGEASDWDAEPAIKGEIQRLRRGSIFGKDIFEENRRMPHSLVACTDAVVCRAGHEEVCRALRGCAEKTPPWSWIVHRNQIKQRLQALFPFSALHDEILDLTVEAFERVEYPPDAEIVSSSQESRQFFLVVEGEAVSHAAEQTPRPLARWTSFGIAQLLLGTPVSAAVHAAATGCSVMVIDHEDFADAAGALFTELQTKMFYRELRISLQDIVRTGGELLGEGQFGSVRRVFIRGVIGESFALKRMSKRRVIELEQQTATKLEHEFLNECCYPLIVRLIMTFQDESCVYMLMENLDGGDLFTAIRDIGALSEEHVLFFGASMVLALEYIHSRGVMYRDLKPENVMLTASGFVKLVDFGCCSRKFRSYTFIGTPEYLAPEVVLGKGYGKSVDWWSFGVIMYEMICGPLPFGEGCSDALETFREILEKPLTIPVKASSEGADLLTSLLERMPENRLGSSTFHFMNEVRAHPYFEDLHWDNIIEHATMPPYQPAGCQGDMPLIHAGYQSEPARMKLEVTRADSEPTCGREAEFMTSIVPGNENLPRLSRMSLDLSNLKPLNGIQEDQQPDEDEEQIEPPDEGEDLSCFEGF